jgi:general secretion pathway protein A
MYNSYFGFREAPFSVTPDPGFFYTNPLYQEALATLHYGITAKKGLIVITGEVGTGKTTLLRKLIRNLEPTVHSVFIFNTLLDFTELLRLTLRHLGLTTKDENALTMIEQLNDYLIKQLKEGYTVPLLIDEAQNLTDEVFEGLRLLSNLETDKEKLLQIVLMGQPELKAKLDQPSLRQLKQRATLRCQLAPLNGEEAGRYIDSRLRDAGYEGDGLFAPDAVEQIGSYSRGIPRLINVICDNALLNAYASSQKRVTLEVIKEVAYDVGLMSPPEVVTMNAPTTEAPAVATNVPVTAAPTEVAAMNAPATASPAREANQQAPQKVLLHRLWSEPSHPAPPWIGRMAALFLLALGTAFSQNGNLNLKSFFRSLFEPPKREATLETSSYQSPAAVKTPKTAENDLAANEKTRRVDMGIEKNPATNNPRAARTKQESITNAKQSQLEYSQIQRKERGSVLGTFEVVRASLVRATPNSDAEIIATLQPHTQVKVMSTRGSYFRVQSMDGETVRGYVHREDAFFLRSEDTDLQPLSTQTARKEKTPIIFLPSPILYRVARDTTLVTKNGTRHTILKGTKVHVAGFTRDDNVFVVSRLGNPDGFIPRSSLEEVSLERRDTTKPPTEASPRWRLENESWGS